jgi:hypothetical protein
MSTTTEFSFNIIGNTAYRGAPGGQPLSTQIASQMEQGERIYNVRCVQNGDTLGEIFRAFNHEQINWNAKVQYLGSSKQITEQQQANPLGRLLEADLIFKDQCVCLAKETLVIASTFPILREYLLNLQ